MVAGAHISEMWRMGRGPRSPSTNNAILQFWTHHRQNQTTYFCDCSTWVGAWGAGKREAKVLRAGKAIKAYALLIGDDVLTEVFTLSSCTACDILASKFTLPWNINCSFLVLSSGAAEHCAKTKWVVKMVGSMIITKKRWLNVLSLWVGWPWTHSSSINWIPLWTWKRRTRHMEWNFAWSHRSG